MAISLIGFGAIGQGLVRLLHERGDTHLEVTSALVRDPARYVGVDDVRIAASIDELLAAEPDVVAEVAGHNALREHGPTVLRHGIDLLFLGVGALSDAAFETELRQAAREGGSQALIVSGAIGGLDALAAAAIGGLTLVRHTTRKPAATLLPAEEARGLTGPRELFRGAAREGVVLFPESVNVAAAVSLAGIGFDRTELCVIADPVVTRNQHTVEAEGEFGTLRLELHNQPSDANPKTGRLVAMSLLHQLMKRTAPIVIG